MTALPVSSNPSPQPPLTAADYAQTPETDARYELQEGAIVMAASPAPRHLQRVDEQGDLLCASDVVLAVEIHSTTTRRTDTRIKHAEYADAGIGHYWMVDLLDGPSLTACHLGGEFGYVDAQPVRGTFTTRQPFPARIELTRAG
jgi:Uma2 family endonuclease